jgi:serine/threonine-protein kinase RIO1
MASHESVVHIPGISTQFKDPSTDTSSVDDNAPGEPTRPAWGGRSVGAPRPTTSLQSIMQEQQLQQQHHTTKMPMTQTTRSSKEQEQKESLRLAELAQEEEMLKWALEQSMQEASLDHSLNEKTTSITSSSHVAARSNEYGLDEASQHLSATELEQIRQALEEYDDDNEQEDQVSDLQSQQKKASLPAKTPRNSVQVVQEDELHAIQRAIQEADELEERQSLELAMQLQSEEERVRWQTDSASRASQGSVRTMTRAQLEAERLGFLPYDSSTRTDPSMDDDFDIPAAAGFRMNAANPHAWARRDRATVVGPNNELRTKHDPELHAQANTHRLGLDPGTATVGNRAFNSFMQSVKRNKKGVAAHGTGRAGSDVDATKEGAIDPGVRLHIMKAINNGLIERFNGVVKEGKEAVVYHANKGVESDGFDVAVKIFKRMKEFKGRGEYLDGDPRYAKKTFKNIGSRDQLQLWAEKEFRNLKRASTGGVPVPTPLLQKDNILFMRFLGEDGWSSPQLRELEMRFGSPKWTTLYEQVMEGVQR